MRGFYLSTIYRCDFNGVVSEQTVRLTPRLVNMQVALNVSWWSQAFTNLLKRNGADSLNSVLYSDILLLYKWT